MGKPYKENIRSGLRIQSKSKFKLLYKVNFSIPFLSDVGNLGNPFVIIVSGVPLYRMEVGEGKCYWFVILVSGFSFYPMLERGLFVIRAKLCRSLSLCQVVDGRDECSPDNRSSKQAFRVIQAFMLAFSAKRCL